MSKVTSRSWLAVCLLGLGLGGSVEATIHTVNVGNFFFNPVNTQVMPGDTVRWMWVGGSHSTTADGSSPKFWDSGVMGSGSYDVVFLVSDGPGPFPYHCSVHPMMQDTIFWAPGVFNARINPMSLPGTEQFDVEVAQSDASMTDVTALWTEMTNPGFSPSRVGWGWSMAAGSPGTWTHMIKPLPGAGLTDEWHPSISSLLTGTYMTATATYSFPPYTSNSAVVMTPVTGTGGTWLPATPLMTGTAGVNWMDYPVVRVDDHPTNPPQFVNTSHFVWTEFIEGGDLDADGDGNMYNDPADGCRLWYTFSNPPGGPGPFPWPGVGPNTVIWAGPVMAGPGAHIMQRPSIDIVGPVGTPAMPSGSIYTAWYDPGMAIVFIDASNLMFGIPFGALTGGAGPSPVAPCIALPQVLNGGIKAGTTVAVAVDNGPNCPGNVYVAWADMVTGDADIMFARSTDGGMTWAPFVRVNSDPAGNGLDQWLPSMSVDDVSGEITIIFKDRRNDPANFLAETWVARSKDCGLTWSDCVLSDPGPLPPFSSYATSALWVGDYLGIDAAKAGWAYGFNDTRNGGDNDVFFDKYCLPDLDGDGYDQSVDCDDTNPSINPGAFDIPGDGIDQNCDGVDAVMCYTDADGDGYGSNGDPGTYTPGGVCPPGKVTIQGDCHDGAAGINPGATEICNGIDEDCDGFIDDNPVGAPTWYRDSDGDGAGDPAADSVACTMPGGYVANFDDCDDTDPTVPPCGCCTLRGDANGDSNLNVSDLTFMVNYLFKGGAAPACLDHADVNNDGNVNVADLTFMVNYLFKGGPAPVPC